MLAGDFAAHRDELIISSKAGYDMWPGPYGIGGSRKYLIASIDQSLRRLGLDYVDIFYSHRLDPSTPLAETIGSLKTIVDQGKALYVGISSYSAAKTRQAVAIADQIGLRLLIHQPSYSILNRWVEEVPADGSTPNLLDVLDEAGMGSIAFSPLAQGMLTDRYLNGIPADSRAAQHSSLPERYLSEVNLNRVRELNRIAHDRGQSLAQMAIAWVLRDTRVTSALIGASSVAQLEDSLGALTNLTFSQSELDAIDQFAVDSGINLWARMTEDK
jgi:L-glyceraldehyde 3-phosphate reductase